MRCALGKCCDARIAIGVNLRRDLRTLELAHDGTGRRDEVALVDVHRIEMERAAAVLGERVVLVGERHRAAIEAVVAAVIRESGRGDGRHANGIAAVILYVCSVRLHPAGCSIHDHPLIELFLIEFRHLKRIDCHVLLPLSV